jgi:hypothetical protein
VGEQPRHTVALGALGGDYSLVGEQAALGQSLEVLEAVRGQGAIDAVTGVENPALRVAE